MNKPWQIILVAVISGGLIGGIVATSLVQSQQNRELSENERIAEFYATETAVLISPHSLRKKMGKGDTSYILVDVRSPQEYQAEHIVGAVNIPAYSDPNNSAYDQVDRIVNSFRELESEGKEIIVYCYSIPCMAGRKIGHMLADHGIYVKELGVGWNEWKYYWNLWNHDGETPVNPDDYVISGPEPGAVAVVEPPSLSPCTLSEEFGC